MIPVQFIDNQWQWINNLHQYTAEPQFNNLYINQYSDQYSCICPVKNCTQWFYVKEELKTFVLNNNDIICKAYLKCDRCNNRICVNYDPRLYSREQLPDSD